MLALSLMVAAACSGQAATGGPTPAQQHQIERLVAQNSGWRVATVRDFGGNRDDIRRLQAKDPAYSPYFSSALEGAEGPFAIALVRDTLFRVVYFPFQGNEYRRPVEVAQAGWFRAAQITLNRDTLRIAEFNSDVVLDFAWNRSTGRFRILEDSGAFH